MFRDFFYSLRLLAAMTAALGLLYPLGMTAFAQIVFPEEANGSLIYENGKVVGSKLIGQSFSSDRYFHGRPSGAGDGYDAASSSGSNLGPTSKELLKVVEERAAAVRQTNRLAMDAVVPSDLVTASGSGLDPHITPAAAEIQVARVAAARKMAVETVKKAVLRHTSAPQAGFMGDDRVNVLMLNLELDRLQNS